MCDALYDPLGWLLELRLKLRGQPEALALVDRALSIVSRSRGETDLAKLAALQEEVDELADALPLRFGTPKRWVLN